MLESTENSDESKHESHENTCDENGDENRCSKDKGHESRCDERGHKNRNFAAKVEGHENRSD